MNKEPDNKSVFKIQESGKYGEVQIADEVVAVIAGIAATEAEGVAEMAGNITNELVGKLGVKNLTKGVKIEVSPEDVAIDLSLALKYGYNIPRTSKEVQEKVKSAIENMTGLTVSEVNIRITGIIIDSAK